jgi:O-antigen biosynthesis protein
MNFDISIVIPNWNGQSLLQRFLPSVISAANFYAQQTRNKVEIVIVDDGSTDESVAWLEGFAFEGLSLASVVDERKTTLRLLQNEINLGFGKTCNKGIAASRYPLVFLLNNDVEVEVGAIRPLVTHFADESVFAVHCRVFEFETKKECGTGKIGDFARGFIRVHQSYRTATEPQDGSADSSAGERPALYSIFASGGSAMYDREKFIQLGSFDELLTPIYWEDVEISYRVWKRGYTVLYEPRSVVHHRVSSTMRKVNRRKIWRMQQRNRIIFHWINLHDRGMFLSHALWVLFLTITAPLRLQPTYILAVWDALKSLPQIRQRRAEEKLKAKRTDRELFSIFKELKLRRDVKVYD